MSPWRHSKPTPCPTFYSTCLFHFCLHFFFFFFTFCIFFCLDRSQYWIGIGIGGKTNTVIHLNILQVSWPELKIDWHKFHWSLVGFVYNKKKQRRKKEDRMIKIEKKMMMKTVIMCIVYWRYVCKKNMVFCYCQVFDELLKGIWTILSFSRFSLFINLFAFWIFSLHNMIPGAQQIYFCFRFFFLLHSLDSSPQRKNLSINILPIVFYDLICYRMYSWLI